VPITQVGGGERPFDALQMNAGLHDVIFGEISRIIKIDKVIARNPAEGGQTCDNQNYDNDINVFFVHKLFIRPFAGIHFYFRCYFKRSFVPIRCALMSLGFYPKGHCAEA